MCSKINCLHPRERERERERERKREREREREDDLLLIHAFIVITLCV